MIKRSAVTRRGRRAIAPVRRTELGGLIELATKLFNAYVVARDKSCQKCGVQINLDSAHLFTAKRFATRWDEENAMALCRGCHTHYTSHPNEWTDFLITRMGSEAYEKLREKSYAPITSWEVKELAAAVIKRYRT